MKKLLLFLAIITTLSSCSLDNDNTNSYSYQVLPVASYVLPESYKVGETYEIILKYQRPTPCYIFQGIYYDIKDNTRTIAIQTMIDDNQVCTDVLPELSEAKFNFKPTTTGTFIFKFYKGKDAEKKDTFDEVEFQVVE